MQSLNLKTNKSSNTLLAAIFCTRLTRSNLVVSPISTVPTMKNIGYLVPHTLTPVKAPRARSLRTTLIPIASFYINIISITIVINVIIVSLHHWDNLAPHHKISYTSQ